ncbi:MAG: GPR endopeptidase, partial [Clostridia bacterium]|nr:GPR endopeptidase [Clostridia bacterium]
LLITSHIKKHMPDVFDENYSNVSAIAPGVMGTTGIETVEIVKGVIDTVRPDTVIAIDALAGADINRVTTSIQIADTGIAPGSGVGNHRNGLNEDSLGVKVIAVGVPTVIAAELLGGENLADEFKSLMVTTNDIDMIIKRMSKTVANGINMALHKNLSLKEAEELVG